MKLDWGKHRGEELADIPTNYLEWLLGQDWLKPDLVAAVEVELETRGVRTKDADPVAMENLYAALLKLPDKWYGTSFNLNEFVVKVERR